MLFKSKSRRKLEKEMEKIVKENTITRLVNNNQFYVVEGQAYVGIYRMPVEEVKKYVKN